MKNYLIKMNENENLEVVDVFPNGIDDLQMAEQMLADYFIEELNDRYALSEDDLSFILGEDRDTSSFKYWDDEEHFFDAKSLYFYIDCGKIRYQMI